MTRITRGDLVNHNWFIPYLGRSEDDTFAMCSRHARRESISPFNHKTFPSYLSCSLWFFERTPRRLSPFLSRGFEYFIRLENFPSRLLTRATSVAPEEGGNDCKFSTPSKGGLYYSADLRVESFLPRSCQFHFFFFQFPIFTFSLPPNRGVNHSKPSLLTLYVTFQPRGREWHRKVDHSVKII